MITLDEYLGIWKDHPDVTPLVIQNAKELLKRVNALIEEVEGKNLKLSVNKKTKSQISGDTLGGFRPQSCPIGAKNSSHKTGQAVDVFDPADSLDWIIDKHPELLVKHNLYREAASATRTWCHLSTRAPKSGKRTFLP